MKMLMLCLFSVLLGACFGASSHFACDDQAIFQSTTGQWGDIVGHARLAVDGNKDTNWWAGSCTHTLPEDQDPFLTLDLGCSKKLAQVVLTNRMDCCTNRLRDFEIVLTQLPYSTACRNQVEICAYHSGTFENTKAINCVGEGRFVTIRYKSPADIPDSDRRLHICEMEVKLAPEPKEKPENKNTAVTATPYQVCYRYNKDCIIHGMDLIYVDNSNLQDCQAACLYEPQCLSFQFNHLNACILKKYACKANELTSWPVNVDGFLLAKDLDCMDYLTGDTVVPKGPRDATFLKMSSATSVKKMHRGTLLRARNLEFADEQL